MVNKVAPNTKANVVTAKPALTLRFKVHTRSGRALKGATIEADVGGDKKKVTSDAQGFARLPLTASDLDAVGGSISVDIKMFHFAPDPGPGGKIEPGPLSISPSVSKDGFDPDEQNVIKDKSGTYYDCVLIDGGLVLSVATPGTVTKRLTDDEVQRELMQRHLDGFVTLDARSEFVFKHDESMGEFDACDPDKCKIVNPSVSNWVNLTSGKVGNVTFYALLNFGVSGKKKGDKIPGQHFLRDTIKWGNMPLRQVDQRSVVGIARLCDELNSNHDIVAIYTQGINGDSSRKDCHGYGRAIDFGGVSTNDPDPDARTMPIRMGVDFIVYLHWGLVDMWDYKSVAANSDNSTWTRQKARDDGTDYSKDPDGNTTPLHYRLDPPPFQDDVPDLDPPDDDLSTKLKSVAAHFAAAGPIFKAIFDFASSEYTDTNSKLGPLDGGAQEDSTAIDDQSGHYILHPDYGRPNAQGAKNGRQAHINHLHFQVGPTNYSAARTK